MLAGNIRDMDRRMESLARAEAEARADARATRQFLEAASRRQDALHAEHVRVLAELARVLGRLADKL